jgi:tape measure domain-containing protein
MAQGILSIKIRADASPLERALKMAGRDMTAFSQKALAIGRGITLGFTAPVIGIGGAFLSAAASMDQLERGMTAIMGSSAEAGKELNKLKESAKLPGLAFEEAVRGSIRLQSVGLKADEARKVLETFGKALSTTGGGAVELEAVQYQLTQMISKNKILAEDFKPIQSAVPLIGKAMQQAFGTDNIEGVRSLGIGAKEFAMRLTESLRILPEVQNSTGGIRNSFDNLKDSIKFASAEMGKVILKNIDLDAIIANVVDSLKRLTEYFGGLSDSTQRTILNSIKNIAVLGALSWTVGQLASSVGHLTYMFGQAVGALIKYNKATNTLTLLTGGYIAIAALLVGSIYLVYSNFNEALKPIETFNNYLSIGAKNARTEASEFNSLMNILKDVNISTSTRLSVIDQLNTKYSDYLPKLLTEKTSLQEITTAQLQGNDALKAKFKLLAAEGVAEKQKNKLIDLETKLFELESKRSQGKVERTTGLTTGLNVSAGLITYDLTANAIKKVKEEISVLTTAYDNTNKSLVGLNIEQEKYNKIINDKKIIALRYEIEDLNLAIDVSTREYGKNNDNVKRLKGILSELQLQYNSLTNTVVDNGNGIVNNAGKTEKVLTAYELLKKKLSDTEDEYKNILLTQGANSASAETLREKYYQIANELQRINNEYDKLENRKIIVDELPAGNKQKVTFSFEDIVDKDTQAQLKTAIGIIDNTTKSTRLLGHEYQGVQGISYVRNTVFSRIARQSEEAQKKVSALKLILDDFKMSLGAVGDALNKDFGKALGEGFDALGTALANGENAIVSFGKAFLSTMLDVISMTLKALLAQITLKEAMKGGGLASVIGLGIGLATVSALKGLLAKTKLARGGLAFGPTMATVGDNPNASFDPEVIAPLSKLKSMLGDASGGMPYVLSTRVSGADLIFMMERANNVNQRIR